MGFASGVRGLAALGLLATMAGPAAAQSFNWDELGTEFCRHALAGDVGGLGPLLSPSLRTLIETAARRGPIPPRMLVQSYDAAAPTCIVRTRNAAIVEIERRDGAARWTDYLVVAPEADGTTRIDDILFSTRRSDTLRERLRIILLR